MFCARSPPVVPVVSKLSGLVYERELILKYIKENDGKDPMTGETLTEDDLVAIKTSPSAPAAPPRPPTLSSIPALLHVMQNEWDATMLEVLELRRTSTKLRQELSYALYKEDASMRVLARITRERDEAREALANIQSSLGITPGATAAAPGGGADASMDVDQPGQDTGAGLPADAEQRLSQSFATLSAARKKRPKQAPAEWATAATIGQLTETETVPSMHTTKPPGISSLDVANDGSLVLTGGMDKSVVVYDRTSKKIVSTLKGHTKKINSAIFVGATESSDAVPSLIASASADKTVKLWAASNAADAKGGPYALRSTLSSHTGEVTALSAHQSGTMLASASADSSWILSDLSGAREANTPLLHVTIPPASADSGALAVGGATAIAFHPDGAILGVGCADSHVRIFDVRTASIGATFEGHSNVGGGAVGSLSFAENGYLLASSSLGAGGAVQIWDLRKQKVVHSVPTPADASVRAVRWDHGAQYLAIAGSTLRVVQNKTWTELLSFDSNAAELTGVAFAKHGHEIITAGLDRSIRVLGAPAAA